MSRHLQQKNRTNTTRTLADVLDLVIALEPRLPDGLGRGGLTDHVSPSLAMKRFKIAEAFIKLALELRREMIIEEQRAIVREGT